MEAAPRNDHAEIATDIIDRGLAEASNISISEAIEHAVARKFMTPEEAEEVLAYFAGRSMEGRTDV